MHGNWNIQLTDIIIFGIISYLVYVLDFFSLLNLNPLIIINIVILWSFYANYLDLNEFVSLYAWHASEKCDITKKWHRKWNEDINKMK